MQNDSNLGSVRSTISSSDAQEPGDCEVMRIKLSIDSAETASAALLLFSIERLWSIYIGNELCVGNLLSVACLCFSASSGSFTYPERKGSVYGLFFHATGEWSMRAAEVTM